MAEEFKRLSRDLVFAGSIIDYYKEVIKNKLERIVAEIKWILLKEELLQ